MEQVNSITDEGPNLQDNGRHTPNQGSLPTRDSPNINNFHNSAQPDSEPPCKVCKGLPYLVPSRDTDWRLKDESRNMFLLPDAVCQKAKLPNCSTGVRIMNNYIPPHPEAGQWLRSAMNGCTTCQIVVDGVDCIRPGWFGDGVSSLANKYIGAAAVPDSPLTIILTDTSFEWYHERILTVELFSPYSR